MEEFARRRYSPITLALLSRDRPDLFVAAAMSLIDLPPSSDSQRFLCNHLINTPAFLAFIGHPDHFSRPALAEILRVLMQVDPLADAKLATTLRMWRRNDEDVDKATVLRILDVLDEFSPGRRLVMTLSQLVRDTDQPVASKAALVMGRRVENASWVESQLASQDARVRANVIESLWGVQSLQARKWMRAALDDAHNRVVGNALVGLFQVGDREAVPRLKEMLKHKRPEFRSTAAWAMGRTGAEEFRAALTEALNDEDPNVRRNAELSLAKLPDLAIAGSAVPAPESNAPSKPELPAAQAPAADEPQRPAQEAAPEFNLRLDGSLRVRPLTYIPTRPGRRPGL